ncbi:MAG: hypothetical protein DMF90_20360 [Acidobacteria bacterium]|nr:MAG: hypothetical protein DMF90_20360 [Acidobacteriota bacterium]
MIITKTALSRRTVLRGLGTTLALPLLDGMVPALAALAKTAAAGPRRFSVIYVAHGTAPGYWVPKNEGPAYELTTPLEPLAKFRDRMLVLSGIDNDVALQRPGDPRGGHGRMAPAFMCGVHAKPTQGADFRVGISIDQIAAGHVGKDTQLPSLQAATAASTPTRSAGAGPPCRCPWRTTRARRSSACSVTPAAATRPFDFSVSASAAAFWIRSWRRPTR